MKYIKLFEERREGFVIPPKIEKGALPTVEELKKFIINHAQVSKKDVNKISFATHHLTTLGYDAGNFFNKERIFERYLLYILQLKDFFEGTRVADFSMLLGINFSNKNIQNLAVSYLENAVEDIVKEHTDKIRNVFIEAFYELLEELLYKETNIPKGDGLKTTTTKVENIYILRMWYEYLPQPFQEKFKWIGRSTKTGLWDLKGGEE